MASNKTDAFVFYINKQKEHLFVLLCCKQINKISLCFGASKKNLFCFFGLFWRCRLHISSFARESPPLSSNGKTQSRTPPRRNKNTILS